MDDLSSGWLERRAEAWHDAVGRRRSRRAFDETPADPRALDELGSCVREFRPFSDARLQLVREPGIDVFRGVVGSYGKVVGAPHVLVVILGGGALAQQHAGYVGEACVLEATRLGLGTCWVAGFFDRSKVGRIVRLGEGEHVAAVSPVGVAALRESLSERAMRTVAGSHARKPLDDLTPDDRTGWPGWALAAAECARLAPSAVNRQPWRFAFREGVFVVEHTHGPQLPGVTKRLDCGIALLHAQLGARHAGVDVRIEEVPDGHVVARLVPIE